MIPPRNDSATLPLDRRGASPDGRIIDGRIIPAVEPRIAPSTRITPRALTAAVTGPDRAAAKRAFEAMMQMGKIDIAAIEAARRG